MNHPTKTYIKHLKYQTAVFTFSQILIGNFHNKDYILDLNEFKMIYYAKYTFWLQQIKYNRLKKMHIMQSIFSNTVEWS